MFIATVPNRQSPPAILLRESYRENGKVKTRTLANLSKLPSYSIETLRRTLRGEKLVAVDDVFQIKENSSRQHGHVQAVLLAMKRLGIDKLLASRSSRERDLVRAMVAARIIEPHSKLATTRWWHTTTLPETLGVADANEDDLYAAMDWLLKRQESIEKKLAARHLNNDGIALYDLSSSYFEGVTCPLASLGHNRDGKKGKLQVNYGLLTNRHGVPVSVSVFEGKTGDPTTVPPQITKLKKEFELDRFVIVGDRGMITQKQIDVLKDTEGVEWITALRSGAITKLVNGGAIQMSLFDERNLFEFTHIDFPNERLIARRNPELAIRRSKTRQSLLDATTKELAKVRHMVERGRLVGKKEIENRIAPCIKNCSVGKHATFTYQDDGFDYTIDKEGVVTQKTKALVTQLNHIKHLVARGRLVGAKTINDRIIKTIGTRKVGRHCTFIIQDDGFDYTIDKEGVVIDATARLVKDLHKVRANIEHGKLYGKDAIGIRVGKVINKYKVEKHFTVTIRDNGFDFAINNESVAAEAALDGIYVIRTSLPETRMNADETVRNYKLLTQVERAFRSMKTIDLHVRPIRHRLENRVRAHIFLCMLAYYVQWHMLEAWRPLLFADEDRQAKITRDPVAPAKRSKAALKKVHSKKLDDGTKAYSFRTLLKLLSGIVRNKCRRLNATPDEATFTMDTPPDKKQQQAFDLLKGISM